MMELARVDINQPRWDQSTYWGRAKYFISTTNPLNIFISDTELEKAQEIVKKYNVQTIVPVKPITFCADLTGDHYLQTELFILDTQSATSISILEVETGIFNAGLIELTNFRSGQPLPGLTLDDVYKAKEVYDSAFHPETGEKMVVIGRMSAQAPMNMIITGAMVTFYKSTPAVVFWQWMNQSFNALVNYTNRSGSSPMPVEQLGKSYVLATGGALVTALSLNKLAKRAPPMLGRLVPFTAVAAANCINIPMMRAKELKEGISVFDANNNLLGESKTVATRGISAVVFSRVVMCTPAMVGTPVVMNQLERKGVMAKIPWANTPLQLFLCGFFFTFATPMCCALFPQKSPVGVASLEPHIQEAAAKLDPVPDIVYYNKGL